MHDVAKRAGVSQTTVSFVINGLHTAEIPEETRERVWDAIRALGYRRNAVAQGLRTKRTNVIGFLTDEVASTPFAVQIVEGAQAAAWAAGRLLMIVNTGRNDEIKQAGVEMMLDRQVDGIIYASWYHREVRPPASMHEVPAVLVDGFVGDRSLPSVVPDEVQGGRAATEYLVRKGHRRIGLINVDAPAARPAAAGRLDGYQQALAAAGIGFDASIVCDGDGFTPSGYQYTHAVMQLPDPPTALFCGNDRIAMGAYQALAELGLSIPGDVAVIGFDNHEVIAAYLRPPLSTMALPHYEMGAWAVRYLIEHSDHTDEAPPVQQRLPCALVERASA
jgi:LacI family transcriptional regulator